MTRFPLRFKNVTRGVTFIEMILYVTLLAMFTILVVDTIVGFSASYRKLQVAKTITDSVTLSFERISRAARDAYDVNLATSSLDVSQGKVELASTDLVGSPLNVAFALENGLVVLYEDGVYKGPLSAKNASTTALYFRLLDNGRTKALRVEMSITATSGPYVKMENFEDTIVLRGSI